MRIVVTVVTGTTNKSKCRKELLSGVCLFVGDCTITDNEECLIFLGSLRIGLMDDKVAFIVSDGATEVIQSYVSCVEPQPYLISIWKGSLYPAQLWAEMFTDSVVLYMMSKL